MKTKTINPTAIKNIKTRIYTKRSRNSNHCIQKSELRYRIMENTMRGFFNYSI